MRASQWCKEWVTWHCEGEHAPTPFEQAILAYIGCDGRQSACLVEPDDVFRVSDPGHPIATDYVWIIIDEHGNRTATTRPEHARAQIERGLRVMRVRYEVPVEDVGTAVSGTTDT